MTLLLIIMFISSCVAFSLSAVCGGGAGLLLLPLLDNMLPVSYVPAALSIGTATSSLSRIAVFFSSIRWSIVVWFVPAAIPAVWLGAWLLSYVNPIYLQLGMGLFLVSNLPLLLKTPKQEPNREKLSSPLLLIIGFLSGFVSGLTGAVGLLFNRFYLRYGLTKEEIVATRAANEFILHIIKICLYGAFGLLTYNVISFGVTIAVAAILSTIVMKQVLPRISQQLFAKLGYGAMILSGIIMLGETGTRITFQNKAALSFVPISKGLETKMQWKTTRFSLEFVYDEGFEYEQVIRFADLPAGKREAIRSQTLGAETVIIEEVFSWHSHSYEAYVTRDGVSQKFDF